MRVRACGYDAAETLPILPMLPTRFHGKKRLTPSRGSVGMRGLDPCEIELAAARRLVLSRHDQRPKPDLRANAPGDFGEALPRTVLGILAIAVWPQSLPRDRRARGLRVPFPAKSYAGELGVRFFQPD